MKRLHKALVAGGLAAAVLVPAGTAFAVTAGDGAARGNPDKVCTQDQDRDRVRARDGTGWRHTTDDGTTVQVVPGSGYAHRSGPQDGSGPQADRPLDGTGNQWRSGR